MNKMNYFDLKGLNIFVSGASGHLGSKISYYLAEAGAKVYLNGRNIKKLNEVNNLILKNGFLSQISRFDIQNKNALKKFFKTNPTNIIINNAYHSDRANMLLTKSSKLYKYKNIDIIKNVIELGKKNLIISAKHKQKSAIINISSMYSVVSPNPKNYTNKNQKGNVEYGIEKLAINKLTKYYAAELGRHQIEVNNLIPGAFPNPKIIKRYPKFINNLKKNSALKKIGYPDDLITSILFLSSKYTRFITGTDIVIDGGWTVF